MSTTELITIKRIRHGMIYRATPVRLARALGITPCQALLMWSNILIEDNYR